MICEICKKEILDNSHYINNKYYHNNCIENLQEKYKKLNYIINGFEKYINEKNNSGYEKLYLEDIIEKLEELKYNSDKESEV